MAANESAATRRLRKFIDASGMSVKAFERKCGLPDRWVINIKEQVRIDYVARVHKEFPRLNVVWWLLGEGLMTIEEDGELAAYAKETERLRKANTRLLEAIKDIAGDASE